MKTIFKKFVVALPLCFCLFACGSKEDPGTEGLEYFLQDDDTYLVKRGTTTYLSSIVIPRTHNGKLVTAVQYNTTMGSYCEVKEVKLPDSITNIKFYSFGGCEFLETINIPNSVTTIDRQAFAASQKITSVFLSKNIVNVGEEAFSYWEESQTIYIEAEQIPSSWSPKWNIGTSGEVSKAKIVLGYKQSNIIL